MSAFSGPQSMGAMRDRRAIKRADAEARNAATPCKRTRAHRLTVLASGVCGRCNGRIA